MNIFRLILKFFLSLLESRASKWGRGVKRKPEYTIEYVESLPEENSTQERIVYIVGENGHYWVAALKCPCGCGDLIQLNLLPAGRYVWRLVVTKESFSIYPSVDRVFSCKSHFNLTNGNVVWWTSDEQAKLDQWSF